MKYVSLFIVALVAGISPALAFDPNEFDDLGGDFAAFEEDYELDLKDATFVDTNARCGDGFIGGGEECDDGLDNSDIKANACRLSCRNAYCGDGVKDADETCDDGNVKGGDGCSSDCRKEKTTKKMSTKKRSTPKARIETTASCGDGVVDKGEDCDDGNTRSNDGCSSECLFEGVQRYFALPFCGDGKVSVTLGEECDDGNVINGDGCDQNCLIDCGGNSPDDCGMCGNGLVESRFRFEECDNGTDECSDTCHYVLPNCGNGKIDEFEQCDNGIDNANETDKCRTNCKEPRCGDGIVDYGEDCDDGNTVSGDGCNAMCEAEHKAAPLIQEFVVPPAPMPIIAPLAAQVIPPQSPQPVPVHPGSLFDSGPAAAAFMASGAAAGWAWVLRRRQKHGE